MSTIGTKITLFSITEIRVPPFSAINAAERGYIALKFRPMFAFSVKGCRDAFITLWNKSRRIYEVGLGKGNNKLSTLNKIGHIGLTDYANSYLDCKKFVPFYITWANDTVRVGKWLTAGKNEILSLQDNPVSPIDAVTIESRDKELYYIIEEGMSVCYFYVLCFLQVNMKMMWYKVVLCHIGLGFFKFSLIQ